MQVTGCGIGRLFWVFFFVFWHWLKSFYNKTYYSRLRWVLYPLWWPETAMKKIFPKGFSAFYHGVFKHTEKVYELYSKQLNIVHYLDFTVDTLLFCFMKYLPIYLSIKSFYVWCNLGCIHESILPPNIPVCMIYVFYYIP